MMTVRQVSSLTGISIRTLQYYDRIGLLKPAALTQAGYRLYDQGSLEKLHQILLLRELEFPLKDIRQILQSPGFDRERALSQQIRLLELRKAHIEDLIRLARKMQNNGGDTMDFSAFDTKKLDAYAQQAKKSWGQTEAYKAFEVKSAGRSQEAEAVLGQGLMDIFRELGQLRSAAPESREVQALVKKLQSYITEHYYPCTNQILLGLGQMYAAGGEFTQNIDAAGGSGTAEFANRAIEIYCR